MIDLSSFSQTVVLCVGDVMLDRFVTGDVKRISPESPVPVLLVTRREDSPGGAANVGRNVASLGGKCVLVGAIGEDPAARELKDLLAAGDQIVADLVSISTRPTSEKTRFVAQGQHLLRADREDATTIPPEAETAIIEKVSRHIRRLPRPGAFRLRQRRFNRTRYQGNHPARPRTQCARDRRPEVSKARSLPRRHGGDAEQLRNCGRGRHRAEH